MCRFLRCRQTGCSGDNDAVSNPKLSGGLQGAGSDGSVRRTIQPGNQWVLLHHRMVGAQDVSAEDEFVGARVHHDLGETCGPHRGFEASGVGKFRGTSAELVDHGLQEIDCSHYRACPASSERQCARPGCDVQQRKVRGQVGQIDGISAETGGEGLGAFDTALHRIHPGKRQCGWAGSSGCNPSMPDGSSDNCTAARAPRIPAVADLMIQCHILTGKVTSGRCLPSGGCDRNHDAPPSLRQAGNRRICRVPWSIALPCR